MTEVQGRIPTAQAYRNALRASCNRGQLLKLWMEGYSGEFPQEVGTVCAGCVDIVIAYVKMWPEFLPDVAVKTLQKTDTLKQNQDEIIENQTKMLANHDKILANHDKIMGYIEQSAFKREESAHTPPPPEVKTRMTPICASGRRTSF